MNWPTDFVLWSRSFSVAINKPLMCKMNNVTVGIKKLDCSSFRGKMAAFLTDGRQIIVPLSFFPEIKNLSLKQRSEWMILDDQYFTFAHLSKVYSVCELLKQ